MKRLLVIILGFAALVCSTDPPKPPTGKTYDFEKVHDIIWRKDSKSNADGACNAEYKDVFTDAFNQMLQAAERSRLSLEWLKDLKTKKPSPSEKTSYIKFLRITEVFDKLFGDAWIEGKGASPKALKLLGYYQDTLKYHQASRISTKKKHWIRCNDEWLQYLPKDSPDPREKGKSGSKKYTLENPRPGNYVYKDGAMYSPTLPGEMSLIEWHGDYDPKKNRPSPYCTRLEANNQLVKAVSNVAHHLTIWCNTAYQEPPYAKAEKPFRFPDTVKEGMSIDTLFDRPMPSTWLHEAGHYVLGQPSDPTLPREVIKEGQKAMKPEPVYFWDMAVELAATHKNDMEMKWPENFAMFATAMYYEDWFWASGEARKEPGDAPLKGSSSKHAGGQSLGTGHDVDPFESQPGFGHDVDPFESQAGFNRERL